jgi:hypothetical protein
MLSLLRAINRFDDGEVSNIIVDGVQPGLVSGFRRNASMQFGLYFRIERPAERRGAQTEGECRTCSKVGTKPRKYYSAQYRNRYRHVDGLVP